MEEVSNVPFYYYYNSNNVMQFFSYSEVLNFERTETAEQNCLFLCVRSRFTQMPIKGKLVKSKKNK